MSSRRQDARTGGGLAAHPDVRAVLRWLRTPAHRQLVRESAVWRAWPALRDSDPPTALAVVVEALRGPCERIPGRKLPSPDRAEVVVVLAYLRGVVVLADLAPVPAPWSWGDLAGLAGELVTADPGRGDLWRTQGGEREAERTVREAERPLLVPRPKNLDGWARLALGGIAI